MNDDTAPPSISVIVPAYNEEACIAACLRSLANQAIDLRYEVVLVDNNCRDRTIECALATSGGLDLRIVRERVQGRGAARRTGFAAARGHLLFSADADTVYPVNWLRSFATALTMSVADAVTGCCRIDDLGPVRNAVFNLALPWTMRLYRLVVGHYWLSGFSFAIRRDTYLAVGGFDPALNAEEDLDLSFRVSRIARISFVDLPVTFSGRRFKQGLLRGSMEYLMLMVNYRWRRAHARLSDVR
jgi:glycosyltransferase involved in cell wall biosynthesis